MTPMLYKFAEFERWLRETHSDAPLLPSYYSLEEGTIKSTGHGDTAYNYSACLCGVVVWAMRVASWFEQKTGLSSDVLINNDIFEWSIYGETSIESDRIGFCTSPEDAWCFLLEAICQALGMEQFDEEK